MDNLFVTIGDAIKQFLIGLITGNLTSMFNDVNERVIQIGQEVGTTPWAWSSDIFSLVQSISENVIMPIASTIVAIVICYDLIQMLLQRNMQDFDTSIFFRFVIKATIILLVVSNATEIVMGIYAISQHLATRTMALVSTQTHIDISSALVDLTQTLNAMSTGELILLLLETSLASLTMLVISIFVMVVIYGRMLEMYMMAAIAPLPLATFGNQQYGEIGHNYLRSLLALAFQVLFIAVCLGIYGVLVQRIVVTSNLHTTLLTILTYTVLLCYGLMRTSSLAKSIFNAH